MDRQRGLADLLGLLARHLGPERGIVRTFIRMEAATSRTRSADGLLLPAEERIQEAGVADVVAQLPMLEEDVHRLPERVVEDLDQLLVDERIRGQPRSIGIGALGAREARRSWRPAPRRGGAPPTPRDRRRAGRIP